MGISKKTKAFKAKINRFKKAIGEAADSKWDAFAIAVDLLYCRMRFQVEREEYFKYKFYNFKNRYRKDFILNCHRVKKYRNITTPGFTGSKYFFYKRIPDLFQREMTVAPFCGEEAFVEFLKKHKTIIVKPDTGSAGHGVEKVEYTNDEMAKQIFAAFTPKVPMICEEYIRQHSVLNELNSSSVNCIRIASLLRDGEVEILSATLKMGLYSDSITDNMSRGGLGAQVDVETGIVCSFGRDFKMDPYSHHPVTGTQIIGLQIPNWDLAIDTVKKAHLRLPQCLIYGWDIAITETGVDIVEANNRPGSRIMQIIDGIPRGKTVIPLIQKDRLKGKRTREGLERDYEKAVAPENT